MPTSKKRKTETKASRKEREKPQWIDCKKCAAKEVILDDLKTGRLPRDAKKMSAEKAYKFYKKLPKFKKVCFSQFEERLADHRKQVSKQWMLAQADEEAFERDKRRGYLANTKTHTDRGDLIIYLDKVQDLIRQDIQDGKHIGLKPSEFQATRREYSKIKKQKFKECLYQAIKRKKFIFHCELDRKAKGRKAPALYKTVK